MAKSEDSYCITIIKNRIVSIVSIVRIKLITNTSYKLKGATLFLLIASKSKKQNKQKTKQTNKQNKKLKYFSITYGKA
jgi:hypothetical protein